MAKLRQRVKLGKTKLLKSPFASNFGSVGLDVCAQISKDFLNCIRQLMEILSIPKEMTEL